jgi:hypothetical protein
LVGRLALKQGTRVHRVKLLDSLIFWASTSFFEEVRP